MSDIDLIHMQALAIQNGPGSGTSNERMVRRLAAATVLKQLEDWEVQPGSPEMSVAQRKSLAAMLDLNLADTYMSEAAQDDWRRAVQSMPALGGGGTE